MSNQFIHNGALGERVMSKKLYEVNIRVYVMAECADEAQELAIENCEDTEAEAHIANSVSNAWWNAIPYGTDDDTTCGEILSSQHAAQLAVAADAGTRG
jgi:hypothetical protein